MVSNEVFLVTDAFSIWTLMRASSPEKAARAA
jgi:hypothetical protein